MKSFIGGAISGGLMALVMAGLLLFVFIEDQLYAVYLAPLIGIVVLGPLLLPRRRFAPAIPSRRTNSFVQLRLKRLTCRASWGWRAAA